MSKETVNYKSSVIVKRSPAVSGQSDLTSGLTVRNRTGLSRSVSQNIHSLNRLLKESEKIMPRTNT